MSQHISSITELNLVAEVAKRLGNGGLKAADVQALLEGRPTGESSLDTKLVEVSPGVSFPERDFAFCAIIKGQRMKRHRNGGGLVPLEQDEADPEKPFVSRDSCITLASQVTGNAKVINSRVANSWVTRNSLVSSSEVINSQVTGNAKVIDSLVIGSEIIDSEVIDSEVIDSSWVINSRVTDRKFSGENVINQR